MSNCEFYVYLPSNVGFSGNTSSNFRSLLPDTIQLSGDWVVALAEITYPYSWNNVTNDPDPRGGIYQKNTIIISFKDENMKSLIVSIMPNHYHHVEELIVAISDAIDDKINKLSEERKNQKKNNRTISKTSSANTIPVAHLSKAVLFSFDHVKKRVLLHLNKKLIAGIKLSNHMAYMLGFEQDRLFVGDGKLVLAAYPPDMRGGLESLYVYTDLTESQIVANIREPLLRIVPIRGKFGDIVNEVFVAPHYIPLLKKEFASVEVTIKSDNNRTVPFNFGKTILKLHFKRLKNESNLLSWK